MTINPRKVIVIRNFLFQKVSSARNFYFSPKKNGEKKFLKPLDKNLQPTPQIWWSKKSSNFEHRNFWWHVPDVCIYYKLFEVTLRYLRTLIFVSRSSSTCGERYSTFYLGIGKKKWSKLGGTESTRFTIFVLKRLDPRIGALFLI